MFDSIACLPRDGQALQEKIHGLVSIVIPCYNGQQFLAEAIESCLRQTYRQIEVIVVDDASPDHCAEIAENYSCKDERVRVIRRPKNGGVARAFNTGFEASRGEYFTRLAQDDLFREDAIAIMQDHLSNNLEVGLVYCNMQTIDERGEITGLRLTAENSEEVVAGKIGLCVMWRRIVWDTVGGFDPSFDAAEDYEYWLRVLRRFRISKLSQQAPFFIRLHPEMGSRLYSARQELAFSRAYALHASDRRAARKILSQGYFEAGYSYQEQNRIGMAYRHLLMAIYFNPFMLKTYRCLADLSFRSCGLKT